MSVRQMRGGCDGGVFVLNISSLSGISSDESQVNLGLLQGATVVWVVIEAFHSRHAKDFISGGKNIVVFQMDIVF